MEDKLDINAVSNHNEVERLNDLLDNYIQQFSDQQNQIGELQKTIMELREQIREQIREHEREFIRKDLLHILNAEVDDLEDGTIDEIVDYILERENK